MEALADRPPQPSCSRASVTCLACPSSCRTASRDQAIGSGPNGITINPRTRTIYVANNYLPGSMSIFTASRLNARADHVTGEPGSCPIGAGITRALGPGTT